MKRLKLIVVLLSFIFTSVLPVSAQNFTDIPQNYWAYNAILALAAQNIISGYSDNTFRPDNPVTRAEFATMIVKALNKENENVGSAYNFRDISPSYWAYNNIQKAYSLELIRGLPNGNFNPNSFITKTELLTVLTKAGHTGTLSQQQAREVLSKFYDANKVPNWAVIPVAEAINANLAVNYPQPNFLMPEKRVSRAEVAAMLYNLRQNLGLNPQVPTLPQQGQYPLPSQPAPSISGQPTTVEQVSQAAASGATTNILLRGSIATIQENSVIPTNLVTPINSEMAKAGDPVIVKVSRNITTNQGVLLIPAGSQINGQIASVTPAKFANRNASMDIRFNSITLPSGQTAPLQGSVATANGTLQAGSLKGKLGRGALKSIGGAGAGAALGTALGAITGDTGKGAIYGTAIGGGLGTVGAILQQGGAIQIPSGEPLFIKLNSPLNVDTSTGTIYP